MNNNKIDLHKLAQEIGCDKLETLARDVSAREYFSGQKGGRDVVLMLYPDASPHHRHEMLEFLRIGKWLDDNGLKSPTAYEVNEDKCYALFEDLGRISFGHALRDNIKDKEYIYTLACDVLKSLARAKTINGLPLYNDSKIHQNRRQIIDFYYPLKTGKPPHDAIVKEYLDVWNQIECKLPPCPKGFVHGDFHLENLMLQPNETGIKKCALIDYQDALYGPLPYDLVNLLEDARADIPISLKNQIIDQYCQDMKENEKAIFLSWYRVLGTQFHGRVLGLFIMLAVDQGRDEYLVHINRLQRYIIDAFNDPLLAPLKQFFDKVELDFKPIIELNGENIRSLFASMPKSL